MVVLNVSRLNHITVLYIDTNILYNLIAYRYAGRNNYNCKINNICKEATKRKTRLVTSIFCANEFIHSFLFGYRGLVTIKAKESWASDEELSDRDFNLKLFKKRRPELFESLMDEHAVVYENMRATLSSYAIEYIYPRSIDTIHDDSEKVVSLASTIQMSYPALDVTDSYHVSICCRSGVRDIITTDKDFSTLDIKDFNVYSPYRI